MRKANIYLHTGNTCLLPSAKRRSVLASCGGLHTNLRRNVQKPTKAFKNSLIIFILSRAYFSTLVVRPGVLFFLKNGGSSEQELPNEILIKMRPRKFYEHLHFFNLNFRKWKEQIGNKDFFRKMRKKIFHRSKVRIRNEKSIIMWDKPRRKRVCDHLPLKELKPAYHNSSYNASSPKP